MNLGEKDWGKEGIEEEESESTRKVVFRFVTEVRDGEETVKGNGKGAVKSAKETGAKKMCVNYQREGCKFGERCIFQHVRREDAPLCRSYQETGNCKWGDK